MNIKKMDFLKLLKKDKKNLLLYLVSKLTCLIEERIEEMDKEIL